MKKIFFNYYFLISINYLCGTNLSSLNSNLISLKNKVNIKVSDEYQIGNTKIILVKEDILKYSVDAIVNAANAGCLGGGGIDGVITKAGGELLANARKNLPEIKSGVRCPEFDARITISGDIKNRPCKAKYVLHAVGPQCSGVNMSEEEKLDLSNTYINTLKRADAFNRNPNDQNYQDFKLVKINDKIESISFPTISTGIFGCKTSQSAEPIVKSIIGFLVQNKTFSVKKIVFVFYDPSSPQKAAIDLGYYKTAFEKLLKK